MPKPIEKTDWATSGAALKIPTDSSRWNLGWQTLPGNLPSQVGEKPNLQQQNYWQFAVHEWVTYFDSVIPDDVGSDSTTDLWDWDTGRIVDGDVYPWCNAIENVGGLLQWNYTSPGVATTWTEFQPETLYGAKYQELLLILSSGLAIVIVDGSDTIYTINPKIGSPPSNALSLSGTLTVNSELTFSLNGAFLDIERDDAGVITNPVDFSAFVALPTEAVFIAKNPDGIRVVASGLLSLSTTTDTPGTNLDILQGVPVKKTWIRPLSNTSTNAAHNLITPGQIKLPMEVLAGRRYRCTLLVNFDVVSVASRIMRVLSTLSGSLSLTANLANMDLGARTFFTDFEFVAPGSPGIEVLWEIAETIDRYGEGGSGDMNAIYGVGELISNWVRVEEVL